MTSSYKHAGWVAVSFASHGGVPVQLKGRALHRHLHEMTQGVSLMVLELFERLSSVADRKEGGAMDSSDGGRTFEGEPRGIQSHRGVPQLI